MTTRLPHHAAHKAAALRLRPALLAAALAATGLLAGCDRNPQVASNDPRSDGAVAMGSGTDGTGVTSTDNPGGLAQGGNTGGPTGGHAGGNAAAGTAAQDPALAGPGGAGLVGSTTTAAGQTTNGNGVAIAPPAQATRSGDPLDRLPATAAGAGTAAGTSAGTNAGAATGGTAPAATGTATRAASLAIVDRNFLALAAEGGLFEVEAGRLASEKGSHAGVKSLGATLSSDHTDAGQRLRDLAAAKGVTLPTTVSAAQRETLQKLSQASGADFDRLFLAQVGIDAHQRDIAAFERAAKDAKDADIKAYAAATLPTLRHHLATAQQLQKGSSGAK